MGGPSKAFCLGVLAIGLTLACSQADAADASKPDKSGYTLFNPTPDDQLRDLNPDRPSRVTGPYTVDAGHFQIESDFLNYTYDREQGATTRTFQAGDPVLKLGVTNQVDVELMFAGYENIRTTGDMPLRAEGFGDVTLASKINLLGDDGGKVAIAILPYLRIPSGTRVISAGQLQGGVLAPVNLTLPSDFSLTLQTEADALANQNGPGTHLNLVNIASLSHPVPGVDKLTGTIELYSALSFEPHTADQYTFDLALAYQTDKNTQVDAGLNIGLNRGTPDYQAYTGVAHRF